MKNQPERFETKLKHGIPLSISRGSNCRITNLITPLLSALVILTQCHGQIVVSNLNQLIDVARHHNQEIKMLPGQYQLAEVLSPQRRQDIQPRTERIGGRPSLPLFAINGNSNRFDFTDVIIEVDTQLYSAFRTNVYISCFYIAGSNNTIKGLTIVTGGPNEGNNGNVMTVSGPFNTIEDITIYVRGSKPFGYGDLLGKGGPNLVPLQKQSGIRILGDHTTLKRCKVISRAFGHCFYIQGAKNVLLEDCYAEGAMRTTADMLRQPEEAIRELGFRSIYLNKDGFLMIPTGYVKSLVEDGFRTYSGCEEIRFINCIAVNTRSAFEVGDVTTNASPMTIENCLALGCERGFFIGSKVTIKRSRADIQFGPALYIRGGYDSEVELEIFGRGSDFSIPALATIAGSNHKVKLFSIADANKFPKIPILIGFGTPAGGNPASPIPPALASNIILESDLDGVPVIVGTKATNCQIRAKGFVMQEPDIRPRLENERKF